MTRSGDWDRGAADSDQRDDELGELLRLAGWEVPLDRVHWNRLAAAIAAAARATHEPAWWELVVQRRRFALAASLVALITAALLSQGPAPIPAPAPLPESVALAHLARFAPEEMAFTALVRASGGDLYADWKEP